MQSLLDDILYDVKKNYFDIKSTQPSLNQDQLIELISENLDLIPYPIVVSDVNKFKPAYLNNACRSFINIKAKKAKEFDNRFYYQYVHNDSLQIVSLGVSHFMNQPHLPYHVCYKIVLNDTNHRWVYLVTHTLDYTTENPSNIKYMISAFVDIQEQINKIGETKVLNPEEKHVEMALLIKSLTQRERTMLSLFSQEYSFEKIAEAMNITPNTVKTYRQKIMTKLSVKTGVGLGKFSLLNEYLSY